MTTPYKLCPSCQNAALLDAGSCVRCGHVFRTQFLPPQQIQMTGAPPVPRYSVRRDCIQKVPGSHSPGLAVVLSLLFFVFAGQLYNGQYLKAVVFGLVSLVCGAMTGGVSIIITYPVGVIDAGMIAGRLNRGEPVSQWQFF